MELIDLAKELPLLKKELKKKGILGKGPEIIKEFFSKELAKLPKDNARVLMHLAWLHYPGFFPINLTREDYNKIFAQKEIETIFNDASLKKFVKLMGWESEMNPLLSFYYVHYFQEPENRTIQEIINIHKSHNNPSYLFWYLYTNDLDTFYQECTYFLSTLSLFYGPDDPYKEKMKEIFLESSGDILLLYYPWFFGMEDPVQYKSRYKEEPYSKLFEVKIWLMQRDCTNLDFECLMVLFNEFFNRKDRQALLDTYRLYLIFGLAIYGFENRELIISIQRMQNEIENSTIDEISDIEKEFFRMEMNVINRFSEGEVDDSVYHGLFKRLSDDKSFLDKRQKILFLSVARLFALSPKLKVYLKKWCDILREHGIENWNEEILETQSELWQAIVTGEEESLDNLVFDVLVGGQLPSIPSMPEVKVILKSDYGEIRWQSNLIKLGENDIKILKEIGYDEKSPLELRQVLKINASALRKAIQRLREKLKGSPIEIKFEEGLYFLERNPEWQVKWISPEEQNKEA